MHPFGDSSIATDVAAILPARFGSSRFPGKPLADIAGIPMIVRVAMRVRRAKTLRSVHVATDDARIAETVARAGFDPVVTSSDCASGTDRVHAALAALGRTPELIVNVQGDEPLIDPRDIDALVLAEVAHPVGFRTLARPIGRIEHLDDPNIVKVGVAPDGTARWFSRAPTPDDRRFDERTSRARRLLHVGIYAYRPDVLTRFVALPPSALERRERLEQLRALEAGIPIHVTACVSPRASIAVDTPHDIARVIAELAIERDDDEVLGPIASVQGPMFEESRS